MVVTRKMTTGRPRAEALAFLGQGLLELGQALLIGRGCGRGIDFRLLGAVGDGPAVAEPGGQCENTRCEFSYI